MAGLLINRAIETAENGIETEEARLETLNREMVRASQDKDGQQIAELSPAIHKCRETIDALFNDLEELYTDKERVEAQIDAKLKALDG